ncbi:MAG: SMC-Scp complex subunit ScpB [Prochlorococcaceae cyanobacterium]
MSGANPASPPAATEAIQGLSLPARMEAILYLKGRPLSLGELAEIAAISREQAELGLITLMADYAHRDTALEIRQDGQRYSLQLRESLGDLVQNLLPVDLSTAALRTLATIALKKRLLQSELVELRGSGAYEHIKELLAQNFIERKRQSEGRSYWLSLSEKFHRTFAVKAEDLKAKARDEGTATKNENKEEQLESGQTDSGQADSGQTDSGQPPIDADWEMAA